MLIFNFQIINVRRGNVHNPHIILGNRLQNHTKNCCVLKPIFYCPHSFSKVDALAISLAWLGISKVKGQIAKWPKGWLAFFYIDTAFSVVQFHYVLVQTFVYQRSNLCSTTQKKILQKITYTIPLQNCDQIYFNKNCHMSYKTNTSQGRLENYSPYVDTQYNETFTQTCSLQQCNFFYNLSNLIKTDQIVCLKCSPSGN